MQKSEGQLTSHGGLWSDGSIFILTHLLSLYIYKYVCVHDSNRLTDHLMDFDWPMNDPTVRWGPSTEIWHCYDNGKLIDIANGN